MKNVLFIFVAATLFSCKGVDQYKGAVEALTSQWDSTAVAVTTFSETLAAENASFGTMMTQMKEQVAGLSGLKQEDTDKINEVMGTCTEAGAGYNALASEVTAFLGEWQTKGSELDSLKAGIEAGNVTGDVMAQIDGLKAFATDAMAKVGGWESAFNATKEACAANMANFSALMETYAPKQ